MKHLIRILILSVILLTSSTTISAAESDIASGIVKATQLIELNPSGTNYLIRATMYSHNQSYDLAILDCNKAIELGYDDDQVYEVRAMSYLNLEKADEAISDCEHILANNPKNAAAYKIRGGAYVLKNNYDAALSDCKAALELDPDDEDLKVRMREIEELKMARDSDPAAQEKDLFNSGWNYFNAQQFDKAIESFTKVLQINPKNVAALKLRGAAYASTDDIDKAITDWEKVKELNPADTYIQKLLDKAYSFKNAQ